MIDLFETGIYLRSPGGNVERPDLHKLVAEWAMLNVGGDVGRDPTVWANQQRLYQAAGFPFGPWLHCRTLGDIDFLIDVGETWSSPALGFNIEDVQRDFVDQGIGMHDVAARLARWTGPIHMPTLPWVQNGQSWGLFKRCVVALEIFADEQRNTFPSGQPDAQTIEQCIGHAFAEGLEHVTLMLKTKGYTTADYPPIVRSLYTGDDIEPSLAGWRAWIETRSLRVPKAAPPPPNPGGNVNVPFTRLLQKDDVGPDVEGVGRALCRAKAGVSVTVFNALPATIRRIFGARKVSWTKAFQKSHGLPQDGVYGRKTHERLTPFFDAKAVNLMLQYKPPAAMCFPFPVGAGGSVCQGFHATAGLPGNWAIDFCGAANTAVLAPEAGKIQKLSGHNPMEDTWDSQGIYGWSVYVRTSTGYVYYITHLGWRASLMIDQYVQAGEILGRVGDQRFRPDHTHIGVTSPLGEADAKKRIAAVSKAARVAGT